MIRWWKGVTPWGRWAMGLGLALLLAVVIGGAMLISSWRSAATAKAETRLANNQAEAALASGADAAETVGAVGARASQSDTITRENDRAIRTAPGAAAPVDAGVRRAGLDSLCRRAAYRDHPDCVQQPAAE